MLTKYNNDLEFTNLETYDISIEDFYEEALREIVFYTLKYNKFDFTDI